jgi:hypothetical protein
MSGFARRNVDFSEALENVQNAYYDAEHEVRKLEAENAKLNSLCTEVASILFDLDVDRCGLCQRDSISHPCPVHTVKGGECLIKSELRELGVEVDG